MREILCDQLVVSSFCHSDSAASVPVSAPCLRAKELFRNKLVSRRWINVHLQRRKSQAQRAASRFSDAADGHLDKPNG
jgi:hypothetical protein